MKVVVVAIPECDLQHFRGRYYKVTELDIDEAKEVLQRYNNGEEVLFEQLVQALKTRLLAISLGVW